MPDKKIFILVNSLNITCGVSSHLFYLLQAMGDFAKDNIILITGGGNAVMKYEVLVRQVIRLPELQHETRSGAGFLKGIVRLRKFIKTYKPAIIHSHHFYAANIGAFARFGFNVFTIQTIHGNIPPVGVLPHYRAHHFILVSSHMVRQLTKENSTVQALYTVIPSPFPFQHSLLDNTIRHPVRFLFAGRFSPEKRVDLFIEAVRLISETEENAEFFIAGEGPMRDYVVAAIKKTKISFIGEIEDLAERLTEYDVIVNCTNAQEGFPTILIQAAASGKCVISSRFKGYSDFLSNENSYLFDVNDVEGLARIIKQIISEPENLSEKGLRLFRDVKDVFRSDKIAESVKSLYQKGVNLE
ncbi:MAG: glycosyltransferase family 4 protein [Ignavibacteriaceae bacterium]|nr:glycosyltransferase family 4 protein [Ignavibacteriaceae bacterium]